VTRIVYGANPVRELIRARPADVSVVYLAAGDTGPTLKEMPRRRDGGAKAREQGSWRECWHEARATSEGSGASFEPSTRLVRAASTLAAPETRSWFQLDRGADCMSVLIEAADAGMHVNGSRRTRPLSSVAQRSRRPPALQLGQPTRVRHLQRGCARAAKADRAQSHDGTAHSANATAPSPRQEKAKGPDRPRHPGDQTMRTRGQTPLRWILFTTHPVKAATDALGVVAAYSRRWRIEDFHKNWKTGACKIEDEDETFARHGPSTGQMDDACHTSFIARPTREATRHEAARGER